jgi:hypothetical protein
MGAHVGMSWGLLAQKENKALAPDIMAQEVNPIATAYKINSEISEEFVSMSAGSLVRLYEQHST